MTRETFESSISAQEPPVGLTPLLTALWYDAKGNWEQAHNIAQDVHTDSGSWMHAYLHRKEGDLGNAAYWYRRAGLPVPTISLKQEWRQIAEALLRV